MSITLALIILTVAASYYAWKNTHIQYRWMMTPYEIQRDKSYYRFITSGFIHADGMHLFFNMFTLFFFGDVVEQSFRAIYGSTVGSVLYIAFYLLGIIVSDIPTYLKKRHTPNYSALGASGGVSAVVFSSILFYPMADLCLYAILCLPGFIWGAIYLIYSYYSGKKAGDHINHDAHLYGALFGIIFTILIYPSVIPLFFEQLKHFQLF